MNHDDKDIELSELLKDGISIPKNRYYIFELNNQLRDLGAKTIDYLKNLMNYLKKSRLVLKN